MTYRNVLVHIDETPASRTRASAAAHVAARFGASLTAMFLRSDHIPGFIAGLPPARRTDFGDGSRGRALGVPTNGLGGGLSIGGFGFPWGTGVPPVNFPPPTGGTPVPRCWSPGDP